MFVPDLVLANLEGLGQVIFAVETHIFDGVLILHAVVQINELQKGTFLDRFSNFVDFGAIREYSVLNNKEK